MIELDEPVLPDDYPVYGNFFYVADGKIVRSDWHDITVRQFRGALWAKEIRRCDIPGRQAAQAIERRADETKGGAS